MKKLIIFLVLILGLIVHSPVDAADTTLKLEDSSGASSLLIHDSTSTTVGTQVFGVDSDGNITMVNNSFVGFTGAGMIQLRDAATDAVGFVNCNVGIGTTAPSIGQVHIKGDTQTTVQTPHANNAKYGLYRTTGNSGWDIYKPANYIGLVFSDGTDRVAFMSGPGIMGIGTTAPGTTLDVRGDITIKSGSDIRSSTNATNAINIANSAGTDFVTFDTTNTRVGILTATPGTALDVRGDITVKGASDIRPSADATNAINIANASGTDFVTFDTTNLQVGIGTTAPQVTLQIASAAPALGLSIAAGNNAWSVNVNNNGDYVIREQTNINDWTVYTDRLTVKTGTGYVGIGTTNPANALDVVGNVCLGNTAAGEGATRTLVLVNGTAPTTSPVDSVQLYAADVSASSELFVRDEAGNATQLSPHNAATGEWIFYSTNIRTGRTVRVEMEKLIRAVEEVTGEKVMTETYHSG